MYWLMKSEPGECSFEYVCGLPEHKGDFVLGQAADILKTAFPRFAFHQPVHDA